MQRLTKDKIIYIAGPMKGIPDGNRIEFIKAANAFRAEGYTKVINPLCLPQFLPEWAYLPICLVFVSACDAVYLLNGYERSNGARIERLYAKRQGKEIYYQRKSNDLF